MFFGQSEIKYLGFVISSKGSRRIDAAKIEAVSKLAVPYTIATFSGTNRFLSQAYFELCKNLCPLVGDKPFKCAAKRVFNSEKELNNGSDFVFSRFRKRISVAN
jgi:hypothetical protein